ncbi:MAG: hypothetical protein KGM47_18225 [Acidobacteriota bacterium]|nr:hypothetical protein [Acidobacteriota bacterium]
MIVRITPSALERRFDPPLSFSRALRYSYVRHHRCFGWPVPSQARPSLFAGD